MRLMIVSSVRKIVAVVSVAVVVLRTSLANKLSTP